MDCVNHTGVNAEAYCQNCGKALCAHCIRKVNGGHVLCEPCQLAWQSYQQPFGVPPPSGSPNPAVAAALGFIPGVGAMYNGQFVKGLIHVVIFAVLVSAANVYGIFGLFIAAWIVYQSFEAYHTAKARRDGTPLPDPLGLNEIGNFINPGAQQPGTSPGPAAGPVSDPGPNQGPGSGQAPPYSASGPSYQAPFTPPPPPYGAPFTPPPPGYGPAIPPIPPVPPQPSWDWRRREPIGAIVLIVLGVLFALGQMDIFSDRIFEYSWPFLLIGLGIWLIVRRAGDLRGGK
jgi:hypothetical protein